MYRVSFDMIGGVQLTPGTGTIVVTSKWLAMYKVKSDGVNAARLVIKHGTVSGDIIWDETATTITGVGEAFPTKLVTGSFYYELTGIGAIGEIREPTYS